MTGWIAFFGVMGLGFGAQWLVRHTFESASLIDTRVGMTGQQVAQLLAGQYSVTVTVMSEDDDDRWLGDHFDPRTDTIVLSPAVGNEHSIAAVAVAAHEAGHALQKAVRAHGFGLRGHLEGVSLVAQGSYLLLPLLALVLLPFGLGVIIGIIAVVSLFSMLVVELVALPVE